MSEIENCEICKVPFSAFGITCDCVNRQDSAFYTDESGTQEVWTEKGNPFYVVRAGEMKIYATAEDGEEVVIRYTDQLEEFGITNDKELSLWLAKDEEVFSLANNSWFEIYSGEDADWFSEPIHEIDEAIKQARQLNKNYPNGIVE